MLPETTLGVALVLVFSTPRAQTLHQLAQAALRVLMFYSVIDCLRAVFNRERVVGAA